MTLETDIARWNSSYFVDRPAILKRRGKWRIWGIDRLQEMRNFEQSHAGMKKLNWPNGE
jgi:hypothetical protein